ncbi:FkbM family methyltransferase [Candidatus Peregrinibacteria bacterium]|nr:FkbM family methyltransferase [Candidatus Peregrinibacteria bacterium]
MKRESKIFGKDVVLNMRNDGDFAIANELFLDRQYKFCDEVIKKAKDCIIDIGGHLGFFSLYASVINSEVPIYSFEPHIGNYEILKQNIKDNRIKNVHPKQLAVSDKIGEAELQISKEDLNHALSGAIEPTGDTQKVQTTTLERIFSKNDIGHCDLIKIDCEGAEFPLIYATPDNVLDKVSNIFLEYHDWINGESSSELVQFLKGKKFHVEKYPNNKMKELGFLWCRKK